MPPTSSIEHDKRRGGIDPAALAAASLAAAISAIAPPGPFGPTSIPIGVTIFLLIRAYDIDPLRNRLQSLAYAAVLGLVAILALGYPLECFFAAKKLNRLFALMKDQPEENTPSEVPPIAIILVWLSLTGLIFFFDRKRNRTMS